MKIVCVGDSITRGQVSVDYVRILRQLLPLDIVENAGVNYDTTVGVLRRIARITARQPDIVTVLIGTNDINYTLSGVRAAELRKKWKLTEELDADRYRRNMRAIIARLRTHARVVVLSPPVLGEDLESLALRRTTEYAGIAAAEAEAGGAAYLPLNETMVDYLRDSDASGMPYRSGKMLARTAAAQHFVLGRSLDSISRGRGLRLTTDTVHLNSRGANMVAELIFGFVTDVARRTEGIGSA
ncbi:SGNH/GDSL hydrolase family protein [Nocardia arthritidis]|uniref:SGNH/GDSL hydrolase family protein n=1 Tax=Nocardia arthritidis TaxID=228602 RepID=A0A6G9YNF3_9NOCA|nr:SGNH/GDSL hydrolase family protein [Nocardia arthritidis]QIS14728.1 SGNH/GDSL hydrolase family protein [Nocardia arthritidis]